ncbi:selenocysteine insertion sequence-binding protein 2 isoform X5 [Trichechus manatus latirostris]|uniref:Selenocysteine insertion sequence-binding protein 2 isoform X5 n=1 Tax=Trichechus manatus latirostris TaxID=127582 RepID=A0A2Y9RGK8_TRIMA|nr:selenocysteine insertion sequence-binding protein 2 isoform X5 [Trichechus manatus latirostris]
MTSERPREPGGEGIKLSADVKPFVPRFAGLNVAWSESSEARVFPGCAATYYPFVQELPVTEQKTNAEDTAFGASTFPPQYLSSDVTIHPFTYSPYTFESTQNVCSVPGSQYEYSQPGCYEGFQTVTPQSERMCPLPQEAKGLLKKKTYSEPKFDNKRADGTISSDIKSAKGSHLSVHAENSLKSVTDVCHKRTDRKSRITEKSGSTSRPEFEFTRLDFPELQSPENSGILEIPEQPKWGPLHSAATSVSLLRERKPPAVLAESKVLQGGNPEQNEVSRKNKKKKEKSKPKYEVLTVQEPPRIEDAEEFPNLAVASERRNRVESTKFQSKQQQQNNFKSSRKKSEIPVQLDLGGMLTALEKKQHSQNAKQSSKPVVVSVGAVPVLSREATSGMKNHHLNQVLTPHNPLDSSAPLRKKGKQREVPKAKKPTSLKKIILKERQERKQQRLQENIASDAVQDVESSGDDQSLPQADPSAPGETEESVPSTLVEESGSEEPLRAEPQSDIEACHLGLDSASFPKIHSRRFRDYCSQMLSKEVDACVTDLLKELVRFQDRMYQKDPVKAKTKRRLVLGLREVLKHLKLRKLKCVIISPNCEKIQSKGGLDDTLHTIIDYACEQNIPFVFALNRKALGRSLNKAVPVSVVGIFSYDGAQDQFHKMVELTMAARQEYKTMLESVRRELAEEPGARSPPSPPPQGPSCSAEDAHPASTEKEEPHYIEIWRKHLEAYNRCAQELEETLGASTSQMMNLKL